MLAVAWGGALVILGSACKGFTEGRDQPVAIEFISASDTAVAVDDTVFVPVRVLNRAGESIPGAPVLLTSLNPDTLGVDSASQSVFGRRPGPARIVARSGPLTSNPFSIRVKP
jgi:hypothetical protein